MRFVIPALAAGISQRSPPSGGPVDTFTAAQPLCMTQRDSRCPPRHSREGRPLHNPFPPPAGGGAEGGGGPAPPSSIWYPCRQDPLSRSATAPPARGSKLIKGLRRRESILEDSHSPSRCACLASESMWTSMDLGAAHTLLTGWIPACAGMTEVVRKGRREGGRWKAGMTETGISPMPASDLLLWVARLGDACAG